MVHSSDGDVIVGCGAQVVGVTERSVNSADELLAFFDTCMDNRSTSSTKLNDRWGLDTETVGGAQGIRSRREETVEQAVTDQGWLCAQWLGKAWAHGLTRSCRVN